MTTRVAVPMPDDRTPRGRGWWVGVGGLCVIAGIVGVQMAIGAAEHDVDGIASWLAAIAGQLVLACALLQARTRTSLGARAALLCVFAIVELVPLGIGERGWPHQPPHWSAFEVHERWVVLAGTWMFAFCIAVTIDYWIGRFRRRGHVQSAP